MRRQDKGEGGEEGVQKRLVAGSDVRNGVGVDTVSEEQVQLGLAGLIHVAHQKRLNLVIEKRERGRRRETEEKNLRKRRRRRKKRKRKRKKGT